MNTIEYLKTLPHDPVNERLTGLTSMVKIHTLEGLHVAFWSESKLDLDTDGRKDAGIRYEPTHQDATSLDPAGAWLSSNEINYLVLPGGFDHRHDGVHLGCLATVLYDGHIAHAVVADVGPAAKFGEGSIALHRALGFERIRDGRILDCGIDGGVSILLYLHSNIGLKPFTQSEIDRACAPWFAHFTGGS